MDPVKPVKIGWKWLAKTINDLIDGVNLRTLIQGDKMLFRETPGGVLISADIPAIQTLIDKTVAAAVAANPPGGGTGGGGTGGGGSSGAPGPDQSGTGDGLGWDFLGPLNAGLAGTGGGSMEVWPNQKDLSFDITSIRIARNCGSGLSTTADAISIASDGTMGGSWPQRYNLDGSPFVCPGGFWYTITYFPGGTAGPSTAPFTVPLGGGAIILGNHTLFIPN